jgi:hypothetical protein
MNTNHEDESVTQKEPRERRLPYHAPRLVSLGKMQLKTQFGGSPGSDASTNDCSFNGPAG